MPFQSKRSRQARAYRRFIPNFAGVAGALVLAAFASPALASPSGVVVSAFQVRGSGGAGDEFVELHNTSAGTVAIGGWKLQGCANGSPGNASDRVTVPAGVTLQAGQYYLLTGSGYSGTVTTDLSWGSTGISDFGSTSFAGIQILDASSTKQDGVGAPSSPCREGTGITTPGSGGSVFAFARTQDTDVNSADFTGPQSYTPHNSVGVAANLGIDDVSVAEGDAGTTIATFTVSLSQPAGPGGVTFDIATADGTASAGSDYVANSLTAQTIPAGSSTYTFDVTINGDSAPEQNETFFVNVTNVTGATITDGQGQGTIVDDDAPHLSIADVSHDEGSAGTTSYTFTVSLTQPAGPGGVTFDIATTDGSATAPSDYTQKALTGQTIPPGSATYSFTVLVNGDTTSEPDESFNVDVSNVVNASVDDAQAVGTIVNDDVTKIHDVQGNGAATPMAGATVSVEGVVTAEFLGSAKLSGFFLQEEDADIDADPNTSEAIFVFCTPCAAGSVVEGQRVRVTGVVSEFFDMTELTPASPAAVVVTDGGNHLAEVSPATISLPVAGDINAFYEAREAMLVTFADTLTISEFFELPRYGQIELLQGGRSRTFTEDNAPSVAGLAAHLDDLARRRVILDDDNNVQNSVLAQPNGQQAMYWPHQNGGFGVGTQGVDYFRGGDTISGLTGVLHWSFAGFTGTDAWRIRPTAAHPVTFTPINTRPATPPDVGGAIRVVGMNLLNYFTTIDTTSSNNSGPCGPGGTLDCRGADSIAELDRQRERASIVICTLNPDVAAFMELENTTPSTTITDLLDAVNTRCGGAHPYAAASTGGTLGTDAIRVQIVYRTGVVSTVGSPLVDNDSIHDRPPTAQTFDVTDASNPAFGQRFTVVANHLKSKGSCPGSGADADQGDGQGCWAPKRTQQANRTMSWIAGTVIPSAGDPDVLLLGDFNSYASEDPVAALEAGGYADMETVLHGTDAYSYQFDGELGHLDYAFANASMQAQLTGADAWHINSDEVPSFDYNDEIRDTGEAMQEEKPDGSALVPPRVVFAPATPYRASDHDPVVVGLFGSTDLAITVSDSPDPVTAGNDLTYSVTATNNGPADAPSASWSDTLPAGTTFVSLTSSAGWSCTTPAVGATGTVDCSIASFAIGDATFSLTVAVSSGVTDGTVLSNTATITSSLGDTVPANNSATATTTVAGAPQGHLTITPTSVSFGNQAVGTTSAAQTVTLGNDGSASLDVAPLTPPTAPFARSGGTCANAGPITIAAGASCTLTFTFSPAVAGAANQVVTVTASAPGSGTITLSGTGVQGHLTILPSTTIDFGSATVGGTTFPRTVSLSNDGSAPLEVTSLTAAAAPFRRFDGTCPEAVPFTIAAGSGCTLQYLFEPTAAGVATQLIAVAANAPGDDAFTLTGTGFTPEADISVTLDDNREFVQVGDVIDYVVTLQNAGPNDAQTTVLGSFLPLQDASWTCTASGGATCADGTGNVLSDAPSVPAGGSVVYAFSGTLSSAPVAPEALDATVQVALSNGDMIDPQPGNNTASDTDSVVIFRNGFDDASPSLALGAHTVSGDFVAADLLLDAVLVDGLGSEPVRIASGDLADGRVAFDIDIARFAGQAMLRVNTRGARGVTKKGAWTPVDLSSRTIGFAWQSATNASSDGYMRIALGCVSIDFEGRSETEHLVRVRTTVRHDVPWLTLVDE